MHQSQIVPLALSICLASSFSRLGSTLCRRRGPAPTHHIHSPTIISSTISQHQDEETQRSSSRDLHQCQGCNRTFPSRNALFRHLRGEDESSADCPLATTAPEEELSMTTVIRYGYFDYGTEGTDATNERVAHLLHDAFDRHLRAVLASYDIAFSTGGPTYGTAARARPTSLRQDEEVAAATSEVLSFNYRLRGSPVAVATWRDHATTTHGEEAKERMQAWLDDRADVHRVRIRLHRMDPLVPRSSWFAAERSCTQLSYRYLMPVEWILPRDDETARAEMEAWLERIVHRPGGDVTNADEGIEHRNHAPWADGRAKATPGRPSVIKRLKRALKATESVTVPNRKTRRRAERTLEGTGADSDPSSAGSSSEEDRLAHGRYGQLWRKRKRCWSNFAHPDLTGMAASPGYEAVWRTCDRAKVVGFVNLHCCEDASLNVTVPDTHMILEFRADGFVRGQIPRVVSSIVAMTRGWLPEHFFDVGTRPDVYLPAPPAPPFLERRLYFESARCHFHELTGDGTGFEKTVRTGSRSEREWGVYLRNRLLKSASPTNGEDDEWLLDLRDNVSPRIRRQIEAVETETLETRPDGEQGGTPTSLPLVATDAPMEYLITLELLRDIVTGGRWPATSDARSRVIKSSRSGGDRSISPNKKGAPASTSPGHMISSGSFTVVNEQIWDNGAPPLGNRLFPNLTKAVFELEKEILRLSNGTVLAADGIDRQASTTFERSPSTHCAVNRNAQFTPHVDSGRGLGQSMSMIAGLGNYTGGEILVEDIPYDIRYKALEFDGWKQLHWTAPFRGERYSLVWFTPDQKR